MLGNPLLLGDDGYQISRSVRFRSSATASFTRTPSASGNRQKFTWSGWVKRCILTTGPQLFTAGTGTSDRTCLTILSNGTIELLHAAASVNVMRYTSVPVYRDPSAWYHIVFAVDTTQAVTADRVKLYVNNVLQSLTTVTAVPLNTQTYVNHTVSHALGKEPTISSNLFDGYMADVYLIDGQQLDPSYFGQTDAATGVWSPKKYDGTYGTNGFYLPFRQTAAATGFNAVTYTGTGAAMSVDGVGFQPDLVWIKKRNGIDNGEITDSVRGNNLRLAPNTTDSESAGGIAISSTGFSFSSVVYGTDNQSGFTYVAWCWKESVATGLDIVTYTGNGTTQNIAHNLSVKPAMVITKGRNTTAAENWNVWHKSLAAENYFLRLNGTDSVFTTFSNRFTAFSSTTMTAGNNSEVNENGKNYVSYVFSEIAGFSSFGSYTGNGSTTGPTITTGFRPRFVMIKRTDGIGDWEMYDTSRDTYNSANKEIWANSSNAERTVIPIDILANGFQPRDASTNTNASGGTYIYAAFADTIDTAFYRDMSGNGNHWNVNNINGNVSGVTADLMLDVPTLWADGGNGRGNYPTINPLAIYAQTNSFTVTNGNLTYTQATCTAGAYVGSTAALTNGSGQFYYEITQQAKTTVGGDATIPFALFIKDFASTGATYTNWSYYLSGSGSSGDPAGTALTGVSSIANGDVIMVALDLVNGKLFLGKNGTWFNSGNPAAGTGAVATNLANYPVFIPGFGNGGGNMTNFQASINFGQQPFVYTRPSGFKALHTGNLPDPTIKKGNQYFDATTYTGNGAASRTFTGLGFQPDLIWTKNRDTTGYEHILFDAVRGFGVSKDLSSNNTAAEGGTSGVNYGYVSAATSDGYTVVDGGGVNDLLNQNGKSQVAWQWNAGGSTVTNTAGSITSQVRSNPTAGISIVTYTGTGVGGTVGHGLNAAPKMIIDRARNGPSAWVVYHASLGNTGALQLQSTGAFTAFPNMWNNTTPTSSVFTIGTDPTVNTNGGLNLAYCFAEVAGFSKFGSYTGNGNADGPFVYCGFRPRWVMIKRTDTTSDWTIWDTARNTYNVIINYLIANQNVVEPSDGGFDIISNGFKPRSIGAALNASGGTYIYAVFAENPFKYSLAR